MPSSGRLPAARRVVLLEEAISRIRTAALPSASVSPLTPEVEAAMLSALCQSLVPALETSRYPMPEAKVARAILAHPDLSSRALARLCFRSSMVWEPGLLELVLEHPSCDRPTAVLVAYLMPHYYTRSRPSVAELLEVRSGCGNEFLVALDGLWEAGRPSSFYTFVQRLLAEPLGVQEVFRRLALEADASGLEGRDLSRSAFRLLRMARHLGSDPPTPMG